MEIADQLLSEALRGIRESLSIEGYELYFEQQVGGVIDITIKAGPDACEECLVPKPILEHMICNDLLDHAISYTQVNLHLPK